MRELPGTTDPAAYRDGQPVKVAYEPNPPDGDLMVSLKWYADKFGKSYHWGKLMGEAAEEIERLRGELGEGPHKCRVPANSSGFPGDRWACDCGVIWTRMGFGWACINGGSA